MSTVPLQSIKQVVLALFIAIVVACSWLAPLEPAANQNVDAGLKRALISFASARALNAVISVAQGTEIAVEPGGVGVNFAPGQILDPVNDLVETFSNMMLMASIAFGIEKMLITIGAHWLISLALTLTALVWAFFHFRLDSSPPALSKVLVVLLMIRFAMPVAIIASDQLFLRFMEEDYQTSQRVIEAVSGDVEKLNTPVAVNSEAQNMLEKLKSWTSQQTDFKSRIAHLKKVAEESTERIVMLIVIFLLQTLFIPIFLVWVLWSVAKGAFEKNNGWKRKSSAHF